MLELRLSGEFFSQRQAGASYASHVDVVVVVVAVAVAVAVAVVAAAAAVAVAGAAAVILAVMATFFMAVASLQATAHG